MIPSRTLEPTSSADSAKERSLRDLGLGYRAVRPSGTAGASIIANIMIPCSECGLSIVYLEADIPHNERFCVAVLRRNSVTSRVAASRELMASEPNEERGSGITELCPK